jgi:hypothetical protein
MKKIMTNGIRGMENGMKKIITNGIRDGKWNEEDNNEWNKRHGNKNERNMEASATCLMV